MENKELNVFLDEKKQEIEKIKEDATQMDIKDFYLNQYHEMFSAILNNRSREIEDDMNEIDKEIKSLEESIDSIDMQLNENEQLNEKVQHLENDIYKEFSKIEEERFNLDAKQNKLKKDSICLFQTYYNEVNAFQNTLNLYMNGEIANKDLLDLIDNLENKMINECYDVSISIKEKERELKQNEKAFNDFEIEQHKVIDQLISEKQSIEKRIVTSSLDSKEKIKEDLNLRIEHKKTYLKELVSAYNELSVRQLKEFNDIYIKNRLIGKDISTQIEEYDNLFKRFKTKLLTVDTVSNQELKKQKRLNQLISEKQRLDQFKARKDLLEEQRNRLNQMAQVVDQTIKELDQHLEDIKKDISKFKHNQFMHLESDYEQDLSKLATNVNLIQKDLTALQDERTYQMFDPNPNVIAELDQKINQKEKALNEAIYQYNDLKNEYDEFLRESENIELKNLLNDGRYFEENIPRVKELREKLENKIEKINNQISDLNQPLKDYNDILKEIDDIKNDN